MRESIVLKSEVDGLDLSVLLVLPDGEPKLVLQLVHGMSEYKERYLPLMEYLAGRGSPASSMTIGAMARVCAAERIKASFMVPEAADWWRTPGWCGSMPLSAIPEPRSRCSGTVWARW